MNTNKYIIGIDPGLTGAITLLHGDDLINVWDMPSVSAPSGKGKIVSPQLLDSILREVEEVAHDDLSIISRCNIEQVGAMPGQGVASMFKFGRCFGVAEGIVAGHGIPLNYITPQKWKKKFGLIGRDKDASRQLCIQMFPERCDLFKLKKHNGRSDAVLIGMF